MPIATSIIPPYVIYIYALTFLLVLPILCRNLPYSAFFKAWSHEQLIEKASSLNTVKYAASLNYLSTLDANRTLRHYESLLHEEVDVTIVVVTIRRTSYEKVLGYLTQVVTQFDRLLKCENPLKTALFLCNTYAGLDSHHEAVALSRYFPIRTRFPSGSVSSAIMQSFEKEKEDYLYCIREALSSPTRYVMLVEDDAVPRPELFSVLQHMLRDKIEARSLDHSHQLAYLKLYFPERWQGYELSIQTLVELMSIGCLGSGVFLYVLTLCRSRWRRPSVIMLLGGVYCMLLAVAVGRQHVEALRRLSPQLYTLQDAPACCTPCVVYTASAAARIATHLTTVTCSAHSPLDIIIDSFVRHNHYRSHLVQPNLVQHVGLLSTIKGISRTPKDFAFL